MYVILPFHRSPRADYQPNEEQPISASSKAVGSGEQVFSPKSMQVRNQAFWILHLASPWATLLLASWCQPAAPASCLPHWF